MKNKIIVIGSINQDLVVQMKRIPKPGETLFGENLHYFPGGKGANQAIATKLLGGDVSFLGKVGDDLFGSNMKDYLLKLDLATFIKTEVSSSTGTAIITVDSNGENAISVIPGANALFNSSDLDILNTFSKYDILLVQNEINLPIILEVIKKAQQQGLRVFYNPAPAIEVSEDIISLCDFIIVNEHELEIFFRLKNINFNNKEELSEILLNLSNKYGNTIILTLGSKGCIAVQDKHIFESSGIIVDVIDTTGAGDCFCGALISFISQGHNLSDSLDFANKAASLSVTKLGASSSFPRFSEI